MSTPSLTARLRGATAEAHRRIESLPVFESMFHGRISREEYADYLQALLPLYEALEEALERCRSLPRLMALARPSLYRSPALSLDLISLGSAAVKDTPSPIAAHLGQLAEAAPHRLVAWVYVRYFGDLSGGQILKKILGPALGLSKESGLAFYHFPQIAAIDREKAALSHLIDHLDLETSETNEIVGEAVKAFEAHLELFSDPRSPENSPPAPE